MIKTSIVLLLFFRRGVPKMYTTITRWILVLLMITGSMMGFLQSAQAAGRDTGSFICVIGKFVLPSNFTQDGGKVTITTGSGTLTASQNAADIRCSKRLFQKGNYFLIPVGYPVDGKKSLKIDFIACTNEGGAYRFNKVVARPRSNFIYKFDSSNKMAKNRLYRTVCM